MSSSTNKPTDAAAKSGVSFAVKDRNGGGGGGGGAGGGGASNAYAPKLDQGLASASSSKHVTILPRDRQGSNGRGGGTGDGGGGGGGKSGGGGDDARLRQGDGEIDRDGYKALVQPVGLTGDHTGPVTSISAHTRLGHFLTCGFDGTVKIFDHKKRLERSLVLGQPLSCVSHLNDAGDVLVGMDDKLVAGPASSTPPPHN